MNGGLIMSVEFDDVVCKSVGSKLIIDPEKLVNLNVISEKEVDALYKILYKVMEGHRDKIKT